MKTLVILFLVGFAMPVYGEVNCLQVSGYSCVKNSNDSCSCTFKGETVTKKMEKPVVTQHKQKLNPYHPPQDGEEEVIDTKIVYMNNNLYRKGDAPTTTGNYKGYSAEFPEDSTPAQHWEHDKAECEIGGSTSSSFSQDCIKKNREYRQSMSKVPRGIRERELGQ